MKNDPNSYHALVGIHRPAFAVSALIILLSVSSVHAADPPVPRSNVSVNVNPTTSYYSTTNSTFRLPNGVSASPTSGAVPVVTKYSGGLQQTIPTGITIDAIRKSAPLPVVARSTTQTLKGAAGRCLKSGRCNVALLVAGEGLNRLFDGLDWVMGEGGKIQRIPKDVEAGTPDDFIHQIDPTKINGSSPCVPISGFTCASSILDRTVWMNYYCANTYKGQPLTGFRLSSTNYPERCFYGGSRPEGDPVPVSDSEIDSGVADNYVPEPSDWAALTPEMQPDDIEITSAPTLKGEPVTTTVYDAEGNPHKVTQTNIWYDFDIRDNPSPRPALDMKTREETETYENGELTGTTTTESTTSSGSGSSPESPPESPIDCDLFPTACAWFDWTQEEPTEPDDDLSGLLQEVPIVSETYTITGGVAACPAPMVLDLSVFGSREVSYQPLCDLASTMKYLYLALMSFAAAVLLNRSVNRV